MYEGGMFINPLYPDTFPEGVDVLQVSSRDVSYSAAVEDVDVVYSTVNKSIAMQRKETGKIDQQQKKEFKYID